MSIEENPLLIKDADDWQLFLNLLIQLISINEFIVLRTVEDRCLEIRCTVFDKQIKELRVEFQYFECRQISVVKLVFLFVLQLCFVNLFS